MGEKSRILELAEERLARSIYDSSRISSDNSSIRTSTSDESAEDEDVSLELVDLNMTELPVSLVPMMADRVAKLSLQGNWLTTLPYEFSAMSKLVYLDIRNNHLLDFPMVLTECPNLEILDLSENKISKLPLTKSLNYLESNLRVLCLSNNNFQYLPPCISAMTSLQFLELENNPLIMPPPEILAQTDNVSPGEFLDKMRAYLDANKHIIASRLRGVEAAHVDLMTDHSSDSTPTPSEPANGELQQTSLSNQSPRMIKKSSPPPLPPMAPVVQTVVPVPSQSAVPVSEMSPHPDRFRSNSESHSSSRAEKRRGLIVRKPRKPSDDSSPSPLSGSALLTPGTENDDFQENINDLTKHVRGLSHDSILEHNHHPNIHPQLSEPTNHPYSNFSYHHSSASQSSRQASQPLHSFHGPPSAPASPFLASRENSPTSSRQGSFDSVRPFPVKQPALPTPTTSQSSRDHLTAGSSVHATAISPLTDVSPGAYFKRLSTLPEEMRTIDHEIEGRIVEVSRILLYSVNELYEQIRRCSTFCDNKPLSSKLSVLLHAARSSFPDLVASLETTSGEYSNLLSTATNCITAVRNLVDCFRDNLLYFEPLLDIKYFRSMIVVCFASFSELHNAYTALNPLSRESISPTKSDSQSHSAGTLPTTDDHLYEGVFAAANAAQSVLGQLTEAISRSAMESATETSLGGGGISPVVTTKMRDLTSVCVSGVNVTRRLKSRMEAVFASGGIIDRKNFWEDLNAFLKAVITILASTKSAMNYLPFLADVRPNLTTLTRVTKEIPVLLEYSSYYKVLINESTSSSSAVARDGSPMVHGGIASEMNVNANINTSANLPPPPTTPLVAVLGPAAQAVLSPQSTSTYQGYSPFIPQE